MGFNIRRGVQIAFFIIFGGLLFLNKANMWMIIFLSGILATFVFGRFYCGWVCPINTSMEITGWISKKLKIKQKEVPDWVKRPFVRYGLFVLFIGLMVFTLVSGKKLPILPIMVGMGAIITIFFKPALWHRYLCPYGTILNAPGRLSKYKFGVDQENCIKCGLCKTVCPAAAIEMESKKIFPNILKSDCIQCSACADRCPKECIEYGKHKHLASKDVSSTM